MEKTEQMKWALKNAEMNIENANESLNKLLKQIIEACGEGEPAYIIGYVGACLESMKKELAAKREAEAIADMMNYLLR